MTDVNDCWSGEWGMGFYWEGFVGTLSNMSSKHAQQGVGWVHRQIVVNLTFADVENRKESKTRDVVDSEEDIL